MHSIAKTCLPGCPDACRALLPFFPTCCHRVNPLRPPSFATAVAAHPLPFTLLPVKTASCLHFKLMDLPRRDKETEQGRGKESWDEKKERRKKKKKKDSRKRKGAWKAGKTLTYATVSLCVCLHLKRFVYFPRFCELRAQPATRYDERTFDVVVRFRESALRTQYSRGPMNVAGMWMSVSRCPDKYKCACVQRRFYGDTAHGNH